MICPEKDVSLKKAAAVAPEHHKTEISKNLRTGRRGSGHAFSCVRSSFRWMTPGPSYRMRTCRNIFVILHQYEIVFLHFKQLMTGFRRSAMMNHKIRTFTDDEISSLKDKLLCIVGKKDPFIMLGGTQLEEQIKRYPIQVIFMEDAGHGINHEKACEVNRIIKEFFAGE